MLVKTKKPEPIKSEPIQAQSVGKKLVPLRCTSGGELMTCPVSQPGVVGDGVNRRNKDGILFLGDDGKYLRNVRVEPDGTVVVKVDEPIDVNMPVVKVKGSVDVKNTLTVEPVMVSNMPKEMRIQEHLNVVQTPIPTKIAPIDFEGFGIVAISEPCKVYSIHLTVCEPTFVELIGITGKMWLKEFKLNLFPLFIQVDKVAIETLGHVRVGGYVVYES